jgi:phage baseplate assembly protein V
MNFIEQLNRWFAPWRNKIILMVCKGIISAAKDSGNLQTVKMEILKDEVVENIPRVQEFGFSSNPPEDSEAIVLCIGADRSNMVVIASDNSSLRPKDLAAGDTVLYNKNGLKIYLKGDLLFAKTKTYNFDFENFVDLFLTHTHGYVDSVGSAATPTPAVTGTVGANALNVPPIPSDPIITTADFMEA